MNARRVWAIGGVLAIVLVLVAGWFLAISPQLAAAASADRSRKAIEDEHAILQSQVARMANIDADALEEELEALSARVPAVIDEPALLREFQAIVGGVGATITGVTFSDPTYFVPATTGAAPADTATEEPDADAESGSDGAAESEAPEEAPPAPAPGATLPLDDADLQLATQAGLVAVRVQLAVAGELDQVLAASHALQALPRILLQPNLNFSRSEPPAGTIDLVIWVLPRET